jgi:hypothetical protein
MQLEIQLLVSQDKKVFSLYRLGRYGWFHVTSQKFQNESDAKSYFQDSFGFTLKETYKIGSYRISIESLTESVK